ncbi:MAG: radical SAM protein [Candidatus Sumerlaeota bacterium]
MKRLPAIQRVYVERSVRDTEMTRRVLGRLDDQRPDVEEVTDGREVARAYSAEPREQARGKHALLLSGFRGEAIKPCPGTLNYRCCQYQILNFGQGCPLDCSYCILQGYFSNPLLTVQADVETFLSAAGEILKADTGKKWRLGTGEFADSLALDPLTDYAAILVRWIRDYPNAILELKSKADHVEGILDLDHQRSTICAWSVNAPEICRGEEFGVATLDERLDAARRCQEAGYPLAFHFDPIFHFEGWEAGYRETIRRIFAVARPDNIRWISLGCFRHMPGLEDTIRRRFPKSIAPYGEFIRGGDAKRRYPQPLRVAIYKKMLAWIREAGGEGVRVYFCMENPKVWREVFGYAPEDNAELGRWLDAEAFKS